MSEGRMVSPNELLQAAKDVELGGRDPETPNDWARVVAFWSCNIHSGVQPVAITLLAKLYDVPLTEDQVIRISEHYREYALQ